jgi:hypothetical protein
MEVRIMDESNFVREWYSEDLVEKILVPNLDSWRSRYDLKEQELLKDGETWVIRNLRKRDITPAKTSEDIQHIIAPGEHCRPDVVAYNAYGDANLAWVILSANNMSTIFEFRAGLHIIIPSTLSLYQVGGILSR